MWLVTGHLILLLGFVDALVLMHLTQLTPTHLVIFMADRNEVEAFTIRVHYGGKFDDHMNAYIGGELMYYDWCYPDYLSFLDFIGMAKRVKLGLLVWL